jgi:general secretion pathway protein K
VRFVRFGVSNASKVILKEDKGTLLRDQRGMALLITVLTVSLLVAVTIQFHKTTWQNFLVSHNYRLGNQLKVIADSGVNIALSLIEYDGKENQTDSFLDSWGMLDQESFEGLFASGTLQLKVVDLSGRLQINSLVQEKGEDSGAGSDDNTENEIRPMFLRLLLSGYFPIDDEAEARSIVDALIDWIDEDDQESDLGAESGFYQSLEKPYSCRNGPVQYIEELLLVKGITPALLFGSAGKNGLADYLTVNGDDGKININTAPLMVIKSFDPLMDDDLLMKLDEYRNDKGNIDNLANLGWYQNIDGWPGDIVINDKLLTNTSSYFKIIATGEFDTLSRKVVAVAERSSESEVKLLGIKTE